MGAIAQPQADHFSGQTPGGMGPRGRERNRQRRHGGRKPLGLHGCGGGGPASAQESALDSSGNGAQGGSGSGVAQPRSLGRRIRIAEAGRHVLEFEVNEVESQRTGALTAVQFRKSIAATSLLRPFFLGQTLLNGLQVLKAVFDDGLLDVVFGNYYRRQKDRGNGLVADGEGNRRFYGFAFC